LYLKDFTYHKPQTLAEACRILEQCSNGAPIAGGTDILVELKKGLRQNEEIVSLIGIKELNVINENDNELIIGACVAHKKLL